MSLRNRTWIELGTLAVLTPLFLLVFPERPMWVDFGLAVFALTLIGLDARRTRETIWGRFPLPRGAARIEHSFGIVLGATSVAVGLLLLGGIGLAGPGDGLEGAREGLGNGHALLALGLYFPWALLQQTLFQFYLFGRLLVLLPGRPPWAAILLTGGAYSLVHLPDPGVAAVTAVAGVFWTYMYYRTRHLIPLALSHAVLGTAFYTLIYGRDLAVAWIPGLG